MTADRGYRPCPDISSVKRAAFIGLIFPRIEARTSTGSLRSKSTARSSLSCSTI